eukprot:PLAT9778.1.p1 GENE.PLAT9778.1~~PLAT9778.1.p1  ORF type:complete len:513 (-),score=236.77 PLAT9778.1:110-1624(-)
MRIVSKSVSEKDGAGKISFLPEEAEDLWHAYNLIALGDRVQATTLRKVVKESATGSASSVRKRMTLTVEVESVDFDPATCVIRLRGRNVQESSFVRMGAYHTLDLELNRKFTIHKYVWDYIALERVKEATDIARQADIAAVVLQPGLAHVCLITRHMTVLRAKVEVSIPRKRRAGSGHSKALTRFYNAVMDAILRHVDFAVVKAVLLASPGYTKDDLFDHMFARAVREDMRTLMEAKPKFLKVHSSSGYLHSLKEVLADSAVVAQLEDTRAAGEVRALNDFFEMLSVDEARAFYGYDHVVAANERCAVASLLVTDDLFRSADLRTRKQFVALVESVKENGGDIFIFSAMHESGKQLSELTGVAALLRFPLPVVLEELAEAAEAAAAAARGKLDVAAPRASASLDAVDMADWHDDSDTSSGDDDLLDAADKEEVKRGEKPKRQRGRGKGKRKAGKTVGEDEEGGKVEEEDVVVTVADGAGPAGRGAVYELTGDGEGDDDMTDMGL